MTILQTLGQFILYMLTAVLVENTIFTRGLGVSRLTKLMREDKNDRYIFCSFLCLILVLSAPFSYLWNRFLLTPEFWYRDYIRPMGLMVIVSLVFVVILLFVSIFPIGKKKELLAMLPLASFNCAVLGPLLITQSQNYDFLQSMAFALGSGLGYVFALWIVSEGESKLNEEFVPKSLQGLPINLLYIGILALVIYGFTGHRLSF